MIVGAGLAGLIAAHVFPRDAVKEIAPRPVEVHKALLRFRTDAVSKLTGIPFRKVNVRKGIYWRGAFHQPDIRLANLYSQKCIGSLLSDRSIWKIDPVERFIAPEDFYEQLIDAIGNRIEWACAVDFGVAKSCGWPFINTAPLPVVLESLGISVNAEFRRAPITVQRYRIHDCDVYQTIYFPAIEHSLYRASITGNLLICEFEGDPEGNWQEELDASFAIKGEYSQLEETKQRYGKIAPIDEPLRKRLIHHLTTDHNIFSLGRFATYRNILLDDVVEDAAVVKRLIHASDYDRQIASL